jgi:hypothetical protein
MPVPISNVTRRVVFAASGTGPYAFTFEILAASDIAVYEDDTLLTLTTDYTVTINANGTGSVTLVVSPTGTQIAIVGNRTIARATDFTTGGDFFANTLNDELDQQTIFAQQNAEGLQRALQAPQTDPTTIDMTLPRAADRAGKYLAFDVNGNPEPGDTAVEVAGVFAIKDEILALAAIDSEIVAVEAIDADVTTVAGIAGNVTTVAGIAANVTTVAGISADVTTVAADGTDIGTVAGIAADVTAVAAIDSDVTAVAAIDTADLAAVAAIDSDVTTVAGIAANVTTVAGISADVTTVAADGTDIGTVATNIANVNTVAGISADVTTVAADGTDIGTVAGIAANVTTVAGVAANVTTVAGIAANVTTVAGIDSDVTAVAADATDIGAVASNIASVNTVAGISADITTVAGIDTEVTAVAGIETEITALYADLANINVKVGKTSDTGSAIMPAGTEAQRDGSPSAGYLRFNSDTSSFEGYDGSAWGSIGGGGTPGGSDTQIQYNSSGSFAGASGLVTDGSNLTLNAQGDVRFADSDSSNWVALQAPATVASNVTWTLPSADGTSGQVLSTDGSGALAWASGGGSLTGTTDSASPFLTAVGSGAGAVNTGVNNVFVGFEAGNDNTTGTNNTAVGYQALDANTTGISNTAVGSGALGLNTVGTYNTVVGHAAFANSTASSNTGLGYGAGNGTNTGACNIAVGGLGLGYAVFETNTTGSNNIVMGCGALAKNSTANDNVAIGHLAMHLNTTGTSNVAVGAYALDANTTGIRNTAVGEGALTANTTGERNTAVGQIAGDDITTGSYNTCIGQGSGTLTNGITTGNQNTHVGYATGNNASTDDNCIVIAADPDGTLGKGSNTGFINANGGGVYNGGNTTTWTTTSDQRLKKNIVDNTEGLEKITGIRVRNFEYRLPEEVDPALKPTDAIKKTGVQLGVIAQELQEVCPDCVTQQTTGVLSVDTDEIFWHMVNAIKELKAEIDVLKSQINGA